MRQALFATQVVVPAAGAAHPQPAAAQRQPTNGPAVIKRFTDLPGWFFWIDYLLFTSLLEMQRDSAPGVLVELGTYLGKSAVVIGDHLRPADRFVALDLFGRTDLLDDLDFDGGRPANRDEVEKSYPQVSRAAFEATYLALHEQLPEIVEGLSAGIVDHVSPGTARFIHVDASHLYEQVRVDVRHSRELLRPDGIVVFDDWRSEHTPGVSAAVWEAVFTMGLVPVALTPYKFYGVYGDPGPARAAVAALVERDADVWSEEQLIAGHRVSRLKLRSKPAATPTRPTLDDAAVDALATRLSERPSAPK